jgi:hypothetical protein
MPHLYINAHKNKAKSNTIKGSKRMSIDSLIKSEALPISHLNTASPIINPIKIMLFFNSTN